MSSVLPIIEARQETVKRKISHTACGNCHLRKVRCDAPERGFPCTNCINARKSDCRLHEKKKRLLRRATDDPVPIRRRSFSNGVLPDAVAQPLEQSTTLAQVTSLPLSGETPGSHSDGAHSESGKKRLIEFVDEEEALRHSITKGFRITYVGKDVSNTSFLVGQRNESKENGKSERVYHFNSDQLINQRYRYEPQQAPREAFILPNKALADELIKAYFTIVNPGCPLVDEEVFMREYSGENPADPPSIFLLQAIMLVGAHVSRARPERDILKAAFFKRARMLFDARVERNRDLTVQGLLLLTWHSDGAEDIVSNAWYWVGVAARIALGLGMHRNSASSEMGPEIKRMWQRTWWILVQFDVTISLLYGRPQAINLDECDAQPLRTIDFEGCGPGVQSRYVMQFTELCVLISKILRERFGLKTTREQRRTALSSGDEALANWCLVLPPSLQMRVSDMDFWSINLHITYNNFLILLHRPHPQKSNDSGPNDASICSAAGAAIASLFEHLREKDWIKYIWVSGVNALFTAMIQVSVESRFSHPVLAINAKRRFDLTLSSLKQLAEYWITAESNLRLFEESSFVHSQHDMHADSQVVNGLQSHQSPFQTYHLSEPVSLTSNRSQPQPTWLSSTQTDLDILAAAAHVAEDSTDLTRADQDDNLDWKHLFPFNGSTQEDSITSMEFMPMEDEWREIYWQEPGFSGYVGDSVWGWP